VCGRQKTGKGCAASKRQSLTRCSARIRRGTIPSVLESEIRQKQCPRYCEFRIRHTRVGGRTNQAAGFSFRMSRISASRTSCRGGPGGEAGSLGESWLICSIKRKTAKATTANGTTALKNSPYLMEPAPALFPASSGGKAPPLNERKKFKKSPPPM